MNCTSYQSVFISVNSNYLSEEVLDSSRAMGWVIRPPTSTQRKKHLLEMGELQLLWYSFSL